MLRRLSRSLSVGTTAVCGEAESIADPAEELSLRNDLSPSFGFEQVGVPGTEVQEVADRISGQADAVDLLRQLAFQAHYEGRVCGTRTTHHCHNQPKCGAIPKRGALVPEASQVP
jgi:hypothetical protein